MTLAARKVDEAEIVTAHAKRAMFSSARDFGWIVSPIALGVVFDTVRSYFMAQNVNLDHLFSGAMVHVLAQDRSVLYHAGMVFMFAAGIGFAFRMLRGVQRLEEWEEKQPR